MVGKQEIRCKWGGVGGRTIGSVLPEGSCPKSRVTWEPGWDNKGGRWGGCENTRCHVWDMSLPAHFHRGDLNTWASSLCKWGHEKTPYRSLAERENIT